MVEQNFSVEVKIGFKDRTTGSFSFSFNSIYLDKYKNVPNPKVYDESYTLALNKFLNSLNSLNSSSISNSVVSIKSIASTCDTCKTCACSVGSFQCCGTSTTGSIGSIQCNSNPKCYYS